MSEGYISLREASELTGLEIGTIRQAVRRGRIQSIKVQGVHGEEVRVYEQGLQDYVQNKRTTPKQKRQSSPKQPRPRIVQNGTVSEPASSTPSDVETELLSQLQAIRAELEANRRTVESLSIELHDARGQIHQLQEQVIKALPAPQRKGIWNRVFKRD